MRIFSLACCLAATVVIGGGQWAALQTVAWARMAVDYTREAGSLRQGLAETFDGEHPCELCRQVKAGVEKERQQERRKPTKESEFGKVKLTAVLPVAFCVPLVREGVRLATVPDMSCGRLADAPPVPPPRVG